MHFYLEWWSRFFLKLCFATIGLYPLLIWVGFFWGAHFMWENDIPTVHLQWLPIGAFLLELAITTARGRFSGRGFTIAVIRAATAFIALWAIVYAMSFEWSPYNALASNIPNLYQILPMFLAWNPLIFYIGGLGYILAALWVKKPLISGFLHYWIVPLLAVLFVQLLYMRLLPNPLTPAPLKSERGMFIASEIALFSEFVFTDGISYADRSEVFNRPRMVEATHNGRWVLAAFGSTINTLTGGLFLFDLDKRRAMPLVLDSAVKAFAFASGRDTLYISEYGCGRVISQRLYGDGPWPKEPPFSQTIFNVDFPNYEIVDLLITPLEEIVFIVEQACQVFVYNPENDHLQQTFSLERSPFQKVGAGFFRLVAAPEAGEYLVLAYFAEASVFVFDDRTHALKRAFRLDDMVYGNMQYLPPDRLVGFSLNEPRKTVFSLVDGLIEETAPVDIGIRATTFFCGAFTELSFTTGFIRWRPTVESSEELDSMFLGYGLSRSMATRPNELIIALPDRFVIIRPNGTTIVPQSPS